MSTRYSLKVVNNSTERRDLCVYQKPVDLGVENVIILAWMTAVAHPKTTVTFEWNLDYSFTWSLSGTLKPGITFKAEQSQEADLNDVNKNQVQFTRKDGAYTFQPGKAAGTPQTGRLYIQQSPTVQANDALVGIGMSNSSMFAVKSQPNMSLVFSPHPEYWIAAASYDHQSVIDIDQVTNQVKVPYDATTAMTATLDSANTWQVGPANTR